MLGNGQPSQEELLALQEEMERGREERQAASQLAQQAAMERGPAEEGYWDVIGDADIAREREDRQEIEEFLATEFSNTFALGNISKADWRSLSWQIETEFWTMLNEFKRNSKMGDDDLRIMYGEDRPALTDEMARRHRSAMQNKKLFASLSIDARGLKSGTEIHAVAKTESEDESQDDQGWISRAKQAMV